MLKHWAGAGAGRVVILLLFLAAGCAPGVRAADPPVHTNRLSKESSPYLLQHAHNPVDWYPWGEEAFAKAKREQKPVFLSIGYSACHWCHVMERESFEDEGIAKLLNDGFVAIKVDREERPDLDEVYLAAVEVISGNGGWPASVFLTAEGKPFFGGTYYPRDTFADLLRQVAAAWKETEKRAHLEQQAARVTRALGEAIPGTSPGNVAPALIASAVSASEADYDAANGGFGGAPKFPAPMRLTLLLRAGERDPKARAEALATLDRMARGGIFDQVGGGFHRYSTDAKWLVPHFEKMLYDNALLSGAYLEAARMTGRADLRRVGAQTLDFVLREMTDPAGGFYATLDADSPGGEGNYYLWRPEETTSALGERDGRLFNRIYDVTPAGNFEGRSIPNLLAKPVEGWARQWKIDPADLRRQVDSALVRLREARARRPHPSRDDKVLANWNGLMLRSLALGYRVTGSRRYLDAARKNAGFLLAALRTGGDLAHSWRAGAAKPDGYLDDYSCVIVGLAALYDADGDPRWIREAQELAGVMHRKFWDDAAGTYVSTERRGPAAGDAGAPPRLAESRSGEDGATPSGQAMAALALLRLAQLTGNLELRSRAHRLLNAYAAGLKRSPAAYATMLLAADLYFSETPRRAADPVRVELSSPPAPVRPGQSAVVNLRLSAAPGWHVNAAQATRGDVIPARVSLDPGPLRLAGVVYPPAQTMTLRFAREPLRVYQGTVTLQVKVAVPAGTPAGRRALRVRIRYQACNDRLCLLPVEKAVAVPLTVVPARRR